MYGIIKVLFAFDLEDLSCTLHPCQYNKAVKQMYLLVLYSTLCKKPHIHRVTYRRQHKRSTSLQMRVYSKSLEGVRRGQQASIISAYYRRMSDARVSSCVKCYGDACCVFRVSDNGFKLYRRAYVTRVCICVLTYIRAYGRRVCNYITCYRHASLMFVLRAGASVIISHVIDTRL
jgi:hypothetical protein